MRSDYDYLDIGTIWQSKAHGTLSLVLAIANLNLPKKYASMNPPSVTFTDGSRIFTSPVERFLELRYFVRKDEYIANKLLDVLSHPITEDEEDEQYDMDDSDDLLLAEDDDYSDNSVAEPVVPVQAQTEAEHSEESKKEVVTAQTIKSTPSAYPVQFVFEALDDPELENDLTNAAKALIRYDQFRTIDGVLYHHLAFAQNNNAVHTLISNVDKLKNCSIQYKDVIIPVNLDLVTSAYTSAENIFDITGKFVNIKLVDNLIIADTTNIEDEDENEDDTTEHSTKHSTGSVSVISQPDIANAVPETVNNSESRDDLETTSVIVTGDVRESRESDNAESTHACSSTFEELEEVSINADLENAEELDADTSVPVEESSESEDNTEDEDHELLVNSLIMPEDEEDLGYEEIRSEDDEIADSLASKLEALIEKSEDTTTDAEAVESDIQSESIEEQQPEEKTEEAKEVKTTEELSSEVIDEVLTAIQEEKTQEEKKKEE